MDTLIEGVHFPENTPAEAIAHKALAVNLSDVAAMGAQPAYALLSLSLPTAEQAWIEAFAKGFHRLARTHHVRLIGGDTTRSDKIMVSVMITGFLAPGDAPLTRTGARPGDHLLVTGCLGDAAAGLQLVQQGLACTQADARYLRLALDYPQPPVPLGPGLARLANAGMDLSDGLLSDLPHMLGKTLGAELRLEDVPASAELQRSVPGQSERAGMQLAGGDDYQLLLACSASQCQGLYQHAQRHGIRLSDIGRVTATPGIRVSLYEKPFELTASGFRHFP
jgi:thiamine-monophosphate kinase